MKEILLSVKPEHLVNILNGKKTIEIRKTIPKCELPCRVWLYCSKGKKDYHLCKLYKDNKIPYYIYENYSGCGCMPQPLDGKVVGSFILNKVRCFEIQCEPCESSLIYEIKGNYAVSLGELSNNNLELFKTSCLSNEQLIEYIQDKNYNIFDKKFYGWCIDSLNILDKPVDLWNDGYFGNPKTRLRIFTAPQSWCYCKYNKDVFAILKGE